MYQELPKNSEIGRSASKDIAPEVEYRDKAKPLYYSGELARAYVPPQVYSERLNPKEGLKRGTIFPELYLPY